MKVLFLTSGMPFPPHSGGQLQQFEDLKRLSVAADIHLRVVSTAFEADVLGCPALEGCCASVKVFAAAPAAAGRSTQCVPERIRQHRCEALRRDIAELLACGQIDAIHVQGYYLMQHLPRDNQIPVVLFEENIEYLLDQDRRRVAMITATEPSWTVTRELEHAAWRRATLCGAVCEDDMRRMLADVPGVGVRLLPNGWDHLRAGGRRRSGNGSCRVGFLGNYGWPPSEDAAVFLLERLWPQIRAEVSAAELVLVGTGPTPRMLELARAHDGVVVTGTVPSVAPLLQMTDVFLCPLRVGGGVRLKMIEALSSGCAVVSTAIGAQGLPSPIRDSLVVADTPAELVETTVALLRSADTRQELGARAAAVARRLPSWDDAAELVRQCWSELVDRRLER